MYSKTISPRLARAKPACAGYTGLFKDHKPSLSAGKPLRGYGVLTAESNGRHDCTTCVLGARASPPACGDGGLMESEQYIRYAPSPSG
jgi:hypothetical protein